MTFKIALVQFKPVRSDVITNLKKIQNLLQDVRADLIVLPELSNTGYLYETAKDIVPISEPQDASGYFLAGISELSNRTRGVIITGYSEIDGDHLYNSAAAVSSTGVIDNYRKIHLFNDEKKLFQPGDNGFRVIDSCGVKIGIMICFDWIFPEAARTLAIAGAQIIAHPANLVLPYCQNAMITRSLENRVFTITANRIGQEQLKGHTLNFTGISQMTNPSGQILYRGPKNKETVHIMSIKPEEALNKRISTRNDLFVDRRPDFYDS